MQLQGTAAYRGESLLFIGLYVHKAVGELHNGGSAVCAAHSCDAAGVHHPQAGERLIGHLHLQFLHFVTELHCLYLYMYCVDDVVRFTVRKWQLINTIKLQEHNVWMCKQCRRFKFV